MSRSTSGEQESHDLEERISALEEELVKLQALAKQILEQVSQ